MELGLRGLRALIPAGTKGLGFGIAKALVAEGASVAVGSRSSENIDKALVELQAGQQEDTASNQGQKAIGSILDVSRTESISTWVNESAESIGGIDILIVNAGGPPAGAFEDLSTSQWQESFELTVLSAVELLHASIPKLKEGGGSILGITSSSIKQPIPGLVLSNVLRSGVSALLKSLSIELAPFGIRVNNIVPGRVDTERVQSLDSIASKNTGRSLEEVVRQKEKEIPLGRYGTTEEFGRAAAFLVSPAASYISGATLFVDGGMIQSM